MTISDAQARDDGKDVGRHRGEDRSYRARIRRPSTRESDTAICSVPRTRLWP